MPRFRLLQTSLKGCKGQAAPDENQDRVFHRRIQYDGRQVALIGVADGITCCPGGGAVAAYLVEKHLAHDRIFKRHASPLAHQLGVYLTTLNASFYEDFALNADMIDSGATLSVAMLDGPAVHCFWVGDSPMFVARRRGKKFEVSQLTIPDLCGHLLTDCFGGSSPFRLKHRKLILEPGDALIVASDGGMPDAAPLTKLLNAHGPTRRMLRAAEKEASSAQYYDDASIVLAEFRG